MNAIENAGAAEKKEKIPVNDKGHSLDVLEA